VNRAQTYTSFQKICQIILLYKKKKEKSENLLSWYMLFTTMDKRVWRMVLSFLTT